MMGVQSFLQLWSAAHPTQFDNMTIPVSAMCRLRTSTRASRSSIKGDPAIKALMTPPKL